MTDAHDGPEPAAAVEGERPAPPAPAWRDLGPAGVLAIAWTLLPAVLGGLLLAHLGPVAEWLEAERAAGLAIYVALFAVTAGLGLLPTYAQAVLGGWVFGFSVGLAAALVGFTLAALLGYGIARFASGSRVRRMIERHPKAAAVHAALLGASDRRSFGVVALLRLPPNSPFALSNLAFAATGVALVPFLAGTIVGMAPRTAAVVGLAHAGASSGARDLQAFVAEGPGWMVFVGGLVVLVAVLALLSHFARAALVRAGLAPPTRG